MTRWRKNSRPWALPIPQYRSLSPVLEYFTNAFSAPGEEHPESGVIPALGINTMDEVMDGAWFVNRHSKKRLTPEELQRGPGNEHPPSRSSQWDVLAVKRLGYRPGILIEDDTERQYFFRFDPPGKSSNYRLAPKSSPRSSSMLSAIGLPRITFFTSTAVSSGRPQRERTLPVWGKLGTCWRKTSTSS